MSDSRQSTTGRLYHWLLKLLPFDFRSEFGGEMERTFQEQSRDVHRREGQAGVLRLWAQTIADLFRVAPAEHLQMLRQDSRYALRMMRKNIGFTTVAILTLALGVGANTAIFSVINAILLRPLPYAHPSQLVILHESAPKAGAQSLRFTPTEVNDFRQQTHALSGVVEYHGMTFTLLGGDEAERVRTGVVSANFFDLLGVKPILGRNFVEADDQPGAPAVLLLSYEFWQRVEHGDRNVVGKHFQMNDRVHTVIGVLPPVPQYPNENDVYMPTSACPFRSSERSRTVRDAFRALTVFGRLKPGFSSEQASSEARGIAGRLQQEYPKSYPADAGYTASAAPLQQEVTRQARPTLLILLAAAGFVLLIACANVANFTMARISQRDQELTLRSALGAGRSRLLRQLLTESVLMGLISAALGLLLASASVRVLADFAARLTPRAREISIDGRVLLFALLAAVVTSVVSGSVLAFSSREQLSSGLKESGRQSTAGFGRKRARNVLIVAQVAFSFVLLIGAGLMLRSLEKLQSVDPGFIPQKVLSADIDLPFPKYNASDLRLHLADGLERKVGNLPGVLSVALASSFPLDPDRVSGGPSSQDFQIEGHPVPDGLLPPSGDLKAVSDDYFKTLGIPLVEGRAFAATDDDKALSVAVINQTMARHLLHGEDPINKRITFDKGKTWTTIVGIVGDTRDYGLNSEPVDEIYLPMKQNPSVGSLVIRTATDPVQLSGQLRRAIANADPEIAIANLQTLEEARHETLTSPRVLANLLSLFAALALIIAATGIGGILALSVAQRMHEIGVRMALGAQAGDVKTMIVRQGMVLVIAGLIFGVTGALLLTSSIKSMLFHVAPNDPLTFVLVGSVLGFTALLACYIPARRATRIDPLIALRHE